MKTIISHFKKLFVLAVLLVCSLSALAYDFMVDSICYNIIGDNQVEVTKHDSIKYKGAVIIPSSVIQDGVTYQVTRIGNNAFYKCTELSLIDIPEGVTSLGTYSLGNCTLLEDIELPNSLIDIESYAFAHCNFTYLHIPRNVASIHEFALIYCSKLRSITCSSLNQHFKAVDGILYSKDMTMLVAYPYDYPATSYAIPEGVTSIYNWCFYNNKKLTEVTFPESLTWIGLRAFSNCSNIESFDVPDGVYHIGVTAFGMCDNLVNIHLPASLDSLQNATFYACPKLTDITIPRNVRYIGDRVFYEAVNLKNVTIEEGSCLNELGLMTFYRCTSLETFDMPNSVTVMGDNDFDHCTSLRSINLSRNLTNVSRFCFYGCTSLTEMDIPGTVTFIDNGAMYGCTSMRTLKIGDRNAPAGTTYIVNDAVADCDALVRLELGANIDTLANFAFDEFSRVKVIISWAATPPKMGQWSAFYPAPANLQAVLYVPRVALDAYQSTQHWQDFRTIVPIEDVGDINGDGSVSIGDVTALIDILLGGETDRAVFCDVNLDGSVSIGDVTALIDILLGGVE